MSELSEKIVRIHSLLDKRQLDGLLLRKVSSFAWATGGTASYVNSATTCGEAALLVTHDKRFLITNNIEATRLEKEEKLNEDGWEMRVSPWYSGDENLQDLVKGMRMGADHTRSDAIDVSVDVARMRSHLTGQEGERFRELGRLCARAMDQTVRAIAPGWTEHSIAARLGAEAERQGVQAIVNLIASDERIFSYRHPLPTPRKLEHYALLVLCGRRAGLVCSITRLVHFGKMAGELRRKVEAVARIDAAMMAATRPGTTLGEVFEKAVQAYAETGFPDEWKLHHQGGPAGYEPREIVATPGSPEAIVLGQAFAWNPSITGVKSEDTFLVGSTANEVVTAIDSWPMIEVEVGGQTTIRPDVLEIV